MRLPCATVATALRTRSETRTSTERTRRRSSFRFCSTISALSATIRTLSSIIRTLSSSIRALGAMIHTLSLRSVYAATKCATAAGTRMREHAAGLGPNCTQPA